MFYNVENLFDCQHDTLKNDYEFLPDAPKGWTPVSYTHLDVYKRQTETRHGDADDTFSWQIQFIESLGTDQKCQGGIQTTGNTDYYSLAAVSYTHLDVYKRQLVTLYHRDS